MNKGPYKWSLISILLFSGSSIVQFSFWKMDMQVSHAERRLHNEEEEEDKDDDNDEGEWKILVLFERILELDGEEEAGKQ